MYTHTRWTVPYPTICSYEKSFQVYFFVSPHFMMENVCKDILKKVLVKLFRLDLTDLEMNAILATAAITLHLSKLNFNFLSISLNLSLQVIDSEIYRIYHLSYLEVY